MWRSSDRHQPHILNFSPHQVSILQLRQGKETLRTPNLSLPAEEPLNT